MIYQGIGVSKGVAMGEIFLYEPALPKVEERFREEESAENQLRRYRELREQAARELRDLCDNLRTWDPEKVEIFQAHMEILRDEAMEEEIQEGIAENRWTAGWAVETVYGRYGALLSGARDSLIRERAADLEDVKRRLLRIWSGVSGQDLSKLERPAVVAARDLLPSDTATMDCTKVLAIVTESGGATSHSAIIARSYGIPAVLGIPDLTELVRTGQRVIVDALEGTLLTDPDSEQEVFYRQKRLDYRAYAKTTAEYLHREPLTKDGHRIEIGLNLGSVRPEDLEGSAHTGFLGLLRTEFLYMDSAALPTEQEQTLAYQKALYTFGDRPVVIRTLDIGGDKTLKYLPLPKEENPFLGNRALRLCFQRPDLFRTQLRAALRASVCGNLWIMFPMVGSLEDLRRAKAFLREAREELAREQTPVAKHIKVGVMVEVPSIALIADLLVDEADFISIGTNDLCQYLTAADRMNPAVSAYYQMYHPALFRLCAVAAKPFVRAGKPVCVCGELAGDPLAAPVLAGLGIEKLSMSISSVAGIKRALAALTLPEMREMASTVMKTATAGEVERYLRARAAGQTKENEGE